MNLGHEATMVDLLFFELMLLGVELLTVGVGQGYVEGFFVLVLVGVGVV